MIPKRISRAQRALLNRLEERMQLHYDMARHKRDIAANTVHEIQYAGVAQGIVACIAMVRDARRGRK